MVAAIKSEPRPRSGRNAWPPYVGFRSVVSLIDRLVHNAEIIAIEGESYRLKEARERTEQRARQRRGGKS